MSETLIGSMNEKYKDCSPKELRELRKSLAPAVSREEFVTYRCRRRDAQEKRGIIYDELVAAREKGEPFSLTKVAKKYGWSPTCQLYGWVDFILGLRVKAFRTSDFDFEAACDVFLHGRVTKRGRRSLARSVDAREPFLQWFIANRNNPDRESLKELGRKLGVHQGTLSFWGLQLGGYDVPRNKQSTPESRLARAQKVVDLLRRADRPLFPREICKMAGINKNNTYRALCDIIKLVDESALDRVVTKRSILAETYNELVDYINEHKSKHGAAPSAKFLRNKFNVATPVIKRALRNRRKVELTRHEQVALASYRECEEKEFQRQATKTPYVRDEDWLARVEDCGFKGFEFTGDYWTRYRKLWERKRARELRRREAQIREEIRAGQDPLITQCLGPRPVRRVGAIAELLVRIAGNDL